MQRGSSQLWYLMERMVRFCYVRGYKFKQNVSHNKVVNGAYVWNLISTGKLLRKLHRNRIDSVCSRYIILVTKS